MDRQETAVRRGAALRTGRGASAPAFPLSPAQALRLCSRPIYAADIPESYGLQAKRTWDAYHLAIGEEATFHGALAALGPTDWG